MDLSHGLSTDCQPPALNEVERDDRRVIATEHRYRFAEPCRDDLLAPVLQHQGGLLDTAWRGWSVFDDLDAQVHAGMADC